MDIIGIKSKFLRRTLCVVLISIASIIGVTINPINVMFNEARRAWFNLKIWRQIRDDIKELPPLAKMLWTGNIDDITDTQQGPL